MSSPSLRRAAGWISRSPIFAGAREKWRQNEAVYGLPLTRWDKLMVGVYIILADTEHGTFPPQFAVQGETFDRERGQFQARSGVDLSESARWNRQTPFWLGTRNIAYIGNYLSLLGELSVCGIKEGDRVLELGCGSGWMSEFLAASGCHCVATSLSPFEIEAVDHRSEIIRARQSSGSLRFAVCAMEEVDREFRDDPMFDFVFVHAALHHAHSWEACFEAVRKVLRPGGRFLICNEPGILHTLISYRVARLDGTHEIGMNRNRLVHKLQRIGFDEIRIFRNRARWLFGPIWLSARTPPSISGEN